MRNGNEARMALSPYTNLKGKGAIFMAYENKEKRHKAKRDMANRPPNMHHSGHQRPFSCRVRYSGSLKIKAVGCMLSIYAHRGVAR